MRRLTLALVPLALAACDHEPAGLVMEELRVSMDVVTAQPQPLPTSPVLVLINNSPGHQVDPHVFGGIASYSDFAAGAQIRYYDFATGMDLAIPTSGNRDQLSDVNAGRIVFTRILPSGDESVMLFDATTGSAPVEVNPVSPGSLSWRSAVAIGGNTIAYVDHGLAADTTGEIVLWDLVLGAATRITDDVDFDQAPAVSSDGNVIVWERCSLTNNCDVAMAVRAGGGWTVSDVAATTAPEGFPDVDDGTVTWTEHTGTDYDIFWRAVGGGAVQQLALAGDQIHGAISGDLITFEGLSGGNTDLFAYHMAEGALYQITNTQGVNESLNDVTVLPGGSPSMHTVRVVWQANDGSDGMNNIYGATFTLLHGDVAGQISDLVSLVESLNLHQGIENSLDAKLDAAESALAAAQGGNIVTACNLMDAFINEVMAQAGKKISVSQASQLIQAANDIKAVLGCP